MSVEFLALEDVERRAFATYEARLAAQRRLNTRGNLWTVALAVSSIAAVSLSITSLAFPHPRDANIDYVATLISLVTFGASLVVALFNFGGRAAEMKSAYRRAQRLAARAEFLHKTSVPASMATLRADVQALVEDYQDLLDESENHTQADFIRRLIKPVQTRVPHQKHGPKGPVQESELGVQVQPMPPVTVSQESEPITSQVQRPSEQRTISLAGWLALVSSGLVTAIPALLTIAVLLTAAAAIAGSVPIGVSAP